MWYFSAAGAPENGQNVISVEKSVLYRVITPSVRKTAGFYPLPFGPKRSGGEVKTGGIPLIDLRNPSFDSEAFGPFPDLPTLTQKEKLLVQ